MWRMDPPLTSVSLVVVPALVAAIRVFGKRMRERGIEAQRADSEVTSLVQRTITALPLVQSYVREEQEESTFRAQAEAAQEKRLAQHGWELVYWLAIAGVFGAGTAAIVWFGTHRVLEQKLTVGELLVFVAYLAQLYEPLNQLSHVGATISTASAGTERVFEVLDSRDEVTSGNRPVVSISEGDSTGGALIARGEISFKNVSFGYQPGQPVLHDLDLHLGAGESVAIVGPSGAGKTTLLNLLPRFFDPTNGSVHLDGVDVRELRLKDLRSQVALVLQEPILWPATVAENVAFAKPHATAAEIESAARGANADEFIRRLPDKYDTLIGEGAAHLSVGEKQRISLARAFLKNAPILLLDEPTSALDAESEILVLESLLKLMRGRTTLIVAHRLSTIQRVDKILVIEGGRLVQEGTPDELLRKEGYYARLVRAYRDFGQQVPG
jgi:ATP-binding cassette subfamily B protein/subfamily B ATP-binding cassette protein MsbA